MKKESKLITDQDQEYSHVKKDVKFESLEVQI